MLASFCVFIVGDWRENALDSKHANTRRCSGANSSDDSGAPGASAASDFVPSGTLTKHSSCSRNAQRTRTWSPK